MSLSEKLNQARRERLVAAGRVPSEPAPDPEPSVEPPQPTLFDPITIEVAPLPGQLVATAGTIELTDNPSDTACPNCHRPGIVDLVDLVGHTRHCSCESCGAMWQIREAVDVKVGADASIDT
ncbi:MAG: hypothetical protein QOJ67_1514 [Acidimicrobiaceae bacterium]